MKEKGFRKLIVWQKADQLAHMVYEQTQSFPKEEIYGITSQIRRAVLSVPTNIVEGCGRQGTKEFKQFINIALGSLGEVEYLLEFSCKRGFLSQSSFESIESLRQQVGNLLWKLYLSL